MQTLPLVRLSKKLTLIIVLTSSLFISAFNSGGGSETDSIDTTSPGNDTESPTSDGSSGENLSSISLSWVAPSEREDNTAISLAEIAGYRLHYGTRSKNYSKKVDINNGSATSHTLRNLPAGTYYLALTTRDYAGRESQFSPEIVITI